MVSVPRQNSICCGPMSAVFGGSTVLNCYYATYSGKKGLKFHAQPQLAQLICNCICMVNSICENMSSKNESKGNFYYYTHIQLILNFPQT